MTLESQYAAPTKSPLGLFANDLIAYSQHDRLPTRGHWISVPLIGHIRDFEPNNVVPHGTRVPLPEPRPLRRLAGFDVALGLHGSGGSGGSVHQRLTGATTVALIANQTVTTPVGFIPRVRERATECLPQASVPVSPERVRSTLRPPSPHKTPSIGLLALHTVLQTERPASALRASAGHVNTAPQQPSRTSYTLAVAA